MRVRFGRSKRGLVGYFCIFLAILMIMLPVFPANALDSPIESLRKDRTLYTIFKESNTMFWNPFENLNIQLCQPVYDSESSDSNSSSDDSSVNISSSGYSRLKWAVEQYGEYAMEMQREYGVPWEVVFAQMQHESSMGTAGIAKNATNNWLGITKSGDAGSWTSSSGRQWAVFSSVEASIKAWAGSRVLRNGYYDDAFPYLDPDNYDLKGFLTEMIHHYAPSSDGNDESNYVSTVLGLIDGPIAEVRDRLGWKSSEELAKSENIQPGGNNSIGGKIPTDSTIKTTNSENKSIICNDEGEEVTNYNGSSIAEVGKSLAWGDEQHYDEVNPAFAEAARALGLNPTLGWSQDCGHFASVVIRSTGIDSSFPVSGSSSMKSYLESSSSWTQIENLGNTSNLESGDVFVANGHIMIYTGGTGKYNAVSASQGDYTGKVSSIYFTHTKSGQPFSIFRHNG